MSESIKAGSMVHFVAPEIVLSNGGSFECSLTPQALASDLSLVIDLYDLDHPVHPEGHLGWWQFPISQLDAVIQGSINIDNLRADCSVHGLNPTDQWVNDKPQPFRRLAVNAVLRSNITNAIISLDKVPGFKNAEDLAAFRSGFSRDWRTPKYASPGFIFPKSGTVRIVSCNIFTRDAVGNLCLDIYRMLKQNQVSVELYAANAELSLNNVVRKTSRLEGDIGPDDQLLYFFSTHDPNLGQLLSLTCKRRIAYFHGVTKPELLQVFDPGLSVVCAKANAQMRELRKFDLIAANSRTSAEKLLSQFDADGPWIIDDIHIIPPRLLSQTTVNETHKRDAQENTRLLYVGRIKSNKKIDHILELFSAYLALDQKAELNIVGGGADKAYMDYLMWVQTVRLNLPSDKVKWLGSINDAELARQYQEASVYVCMSEDEGFCLPILEAMLANLPVFTYGLPAIREVLDGNGVFFMEKDFKHLAQKLHALLDDKELLASIILRQKNRAKELAATMHGDAFFKLLEAF